MLIGICGSIGSGKDTVAQYLCDSREFARISIAGSLKDATSVLFGWDRDMLEGKTKESREQRELPDPFWTEKLGRDFSPRHALQLLGTDLFRDNLHPDIWVFAAEHKLNQLKSTNVVISDIRFPNEINMIRRRGGKIWWVYRTPFPEWWEYALETNKSIAANSTSMPTEWILRDKGIHMGVKFPEIHYSEWAWIRDDYDCVLENNESLASLYSKVEDILSDDPRYNFRMDGEVY